MDRIKENESENITVRALVVEVTYILGFSCVCFFYFAFI